MLIECLNLFSVERLCKSFLVSFRMKTSGLGVGSFSHTSELCFLQYIKTKQQCWCLVALETKLFTLCRVFSLCCCGVCYLYDSQFDFSANCLLLELGYLCKRTHCCLWLGNTTRNCSVPSLFTPAGSQQHLCHEAIAKARIYLLPKRKTEPIVRECFRVALVTSTAEEWFLLTLPSLETGEMQY